MWQKSALPIVHPTLKLLRFVSQSKIIAFIYETLIIVRKQILDMVPISVS